MKSGKIVRVGGGGGCAEDRVDPAVEMIERGNLDYICFDALSENELSNIAIKKVHEPDFAGYDISLEKRMSQVLEVALKHKVKIVSNMGSANPAAAAQYCVDMAKRLGYSNIKVAAVLGDNVLDYLKTTEKEYHTVEDNENMMDLRDNLIAAHTYIPCYGACEALEAGADIVLSGRIGDSAMFLSILKYEYGWADDDWDNLAKGITVGHLMECAGQLSGGVYADPPYKIVPNLHKLGFPIAVCYENGDIIFEKTPDSGGLMSVDTCKEQMIYEVHDPKNYCHAEVIADVSQVAFEQVGVDRVKLSGIITGKPKPEKLKVALGVQHGWYGCSTVWYGGPGARQRAELARDTLYQRFDYLGYKPYRVKITLMGIDGMFMNAPGVPKDLDPWEVGVRMAVNSPSKEEVLYMMTETCANMTTNGPAGMNGEQISWAPREAVSYYHMFIERDVIKHGIQYLEV